MIKNIAPFHMNTAMKKILLIGYLLASVYTANAQAAKELSLEECYSLARENYPLVKQRELIVQSSAYSIDNISKGYLPQVNFIGQATYQSDVTQVPISLPNMSIPTLGKDQYKIYGEVIQTLYDGGMISGQKRIQESNAEVETRKLDVELYKLKERVNQLFFGILLVDEQAKQVTLLKNDIQSAIKKTEAAIANGTALKTSADQLTVELLKANQRSIELKAMRKAYTDMLSLFINKTLDEQTVFTKPSAIINTDEINRPELALYDQQQKTLDAQSKVINARNMPRLGLFAQGGYARPALNMLSNQFDWYYIGGIRMTWTLSGFYTSGKEKQIINLNQKTIGLQKETFLLNTNFSLKQQHAEVQRLQELIQSDNEIIVIREKIKNTSAVQLETGVINTNDFLHEVNAADQARQNLVLHQMQLLMAQYTQQTTTGH